MDASSGFAVHKTFTGEVEEWEPDAEQAYADFLKRDPYMTFYEKSMFLHVCQKWAGVKGEPRVSAETVREKTKGWA